MLKEQEASVVALTEKLETTKVTLQAENRALSLKHDKEMKKLVDMTISYWSFLSNMFAHGSMCTHTHTSMNMYGM